jgi:hypothetical protein
MYGNDETSCETRPVRLSQSRTTTRSVICHIKGPSLLGTQRSEFPWPSEGLSKSMLLRGVNLWLCLKPQIRDSHAHGMALESAKQEVFVFDTLIMDVFPCVMRYAVIEDFR